jgi:hypothetical protein
VPIRGRLNKRSQRTEPESHSRVDATDEGAYNPTVTINPPHQKSRNFQMFLAVNPVIDLS